MNEEIEFETYLSISPYRIGIYLFDTKNLKNLYKQEINYNENIYINGFSNLKNFLDNNIFKIEKFLGKFVENIFLVIESEKVFNLSIGIKKKNYDNKINKEYLESSITEVKDLFKENYQNQIIMHIILNKYLINGSNYSLSIDNQRGNQINLEIQFKSISNDIINDFNKVLENYQIKIIKYLDAYYIKNFFQDGNTDIAKMAHKILGGYNENEVMIVPKNLKKYDFFEKFFQLFS